jgi:hypothetical protein
MYNDRAVCWSFLLHSRTSDQKPIYKETISPINGPHPQDAGDVKGTFYASLFGTNRVCSLIAPLLKGSRDIAISLKI